MPSKYRQFDCEMKKGGFLLKVLVIRTPTEVGWGSYELRMLKGGVGMNGQNGVSLTLQEAFWVNLEVLGKVLFWF